MIQELDPWTLDRQVELTAIPAPPFGEGPRGERMAELFREVGLEGVHVDEVGNVLGELGGLGGIPDGTHRSPEGEEADPGEPGPLIISAHLDTVFPPGTEVSPTRDGDVIRAPGIADDGRGLAGLLTLARVLTELPLPLPFPLCFAATVGEEGIGDLRGVRHLFREGGRARQARGFLSLDGIGLDRIIVQGVGSTRLRVLLRGPGGHSWTDWGTANPIHALGRVVAEAETLPRSKEARTTLTVARWGGGKSINAIPQEAWVEVDLRSEEAGALAWLEEAFRAVCKRAQAGGDQRVAPGGKSGSGGKSEVGAGGTSFGELTLEIQELGRRPAGSTDPDHPLVRAAVEATRALGHEPLLVPSSTDANLPMSLGVPAITLGAGGTAGGIHTLEEWYRNDQGPEGVLRALHTVLLLS
jgi:acetylornithine deacetylase/succinyl-diaminopimelate desuccinylase-like protein